MNILLVGGSSSHCSTCRKNGTRADASPAEPGHLTLLGWGPDNGDPGCGNEWDRWTFETQYGWSEETHQFYIKNFESRHPHLEGKYIDVMEIFGSLR